MAPVQARATAPSSIDPDDVLGRRTRQEDVGDAELLELLDVLVRG